MNYDKAALIVTKWKLLIGQRINGRKIDALAILPSKGDVNPFLSDLVKEGSLYASIYPAGDYLPAVVYDLELHKPANLRHLPQWEYLFGFLETLKSQGIDPRVLINPF